MRKLETVAVLRHTLSVLRDLPLMTRATGTWFIVLVVAGGLHVIWSQSITVGLAGAVVQAFALAACAVNVHRAILLREPPARTRLSRLEWRYLLRSIWIALPAFFVVVVGAILLAIFGPEMLTSLSPTGRAVYGLLVGGTMLALVVPLSLSLPAAAIGRLDFTASNSLDAASGNMLQLLGLAIIGVLPGFVAGGVDWFAGVALSGVISRAVTVPIDAAIAVFQAAVDAAFLSFAYRGLVEGDPTFAREIGQSAPSGV